MLTDEQMTAAQADGAGKIVAGAGCGKTSTLVARVEHLVHRKNIHPSRIMVVTFTRYAAKEIRDRLGDLGKLCDVGTFHSLILRFMGTIGNQPAPIGDDQAEALLKECCLKRGVAYMEKERLKFQKNRFKHYQKLLETGDRDREGVIDLYKETLRNNNEIDYDTILTKGHKFASAGMMPYTHVIVDEAQDNNETQWQILESLENHGCEITVVGDAAQSIYEFRGATPGRFLEKEWPEYQLTRSFRSPSDIADIANRNPQSALTLATDKPPCGAQAFKEDIEDLVSGVMQEGNDWDDVAILCRYNRDVDHLRELLSQKFQVALPKVRVKGPLTKLMLYLANPHSSTYQLAARECKAISAIKWLYQPHDVCHNLTEDFLGRNGKSVDAILRMVDRPGYEHERRYLLDMYSGDTIKFLASEESVGGASRVETSGITVCTVHASKGLEWPVTILYDASKGKWPRRVTDEEWRIWYVATTRSIDKIYVLHNGDPSEFVRRTMCV